MIAAIIPAAGRSRRMGDGVQKLLLPLNGKAMVAHVVDQLLEAFVETPHAVVVVTRLGDTAIAAALTGRSVRFAVNPDADGDMLSSIRAGLRAVPRDTAGVLVAPADLPHISRAIVRELLDAFAAAPDRIVVPVHAGRRGHPILFPGSMRDEVLTKFDGEGLRGLLQAHSVQVLEVAVESAAVVEDIDSPEDYQRAKRAALIPSSGTPGEG